MCLLSWCSPTPWLSAIRDEISRASPPNAAMAEAASAASAARPPSRVLFFGWGAAAKEVLLELVEYARKGLCTVHCISHDSQASDCSLSEVCAELGFSCVLSDEREEIFSTSRDFAPSLIVSASYRHRIHSRVLDLCADRVNFHPSLLPRHRGCWSGFWSIFEGDTETGVTCHRMVEEFDRGHILHQERTDIGPEDTSFSLYRKLLPVTASCARRVFAMHFEGGLPLGQDQTGPASYHFRKLPFDGLIQPEWSDEQVGRFIRAMVFPPFKGAAVLVGEERVEVDSLEAYNSLRRGAAATAAVVAAAAAASTSVPPMVVASPQAASAPSGDHA